MGINDAAKAAFKRAGASISGGGLQKLTITTYDLSDKQFGDPIEALFNPNAINLSRTVNYRQKKTASQGASGLVIMKQDFNSVKAETLSIELFFDTYEPRNSSTLDRAAAALVPTNPFQQGSTKSVRDYTKQIARLAKIDRDLHQPPICHLVWGEFDIFRGVLTNLDQRFTLFLANGTPVRATLSCTFVEFRTKAAYDAELRSSDVTKTLTVRRHDTLHSLAAEEYNDPGLWRHIAKANGIINPRDVRPGMKLTIPKLQA